MIMLANAPMWDIYRKIPYQLFFNIISDYFIRNSFVLFQFILPVETVYYTFKINVHIIPFVHGYRILWVLFFFCLRRGIFNFFDGDCVYKNVVKLCVGSYRSHTTSLSVTADV